MADIEWEPSMRHGMITGALNAGLGTAAIGMVSHLVGVHVLFPIAGTIGGALALWAVGITRGHQGGVLVFAPACWIAAGIWVSWTTVTTPWSLTAFCALIIGAILGGLTAVACFGKKRREQQTEQQRRTLLASRRTKLALAWEARLARVCGIKGAHVVGIEDWDTSTGYTLDVELPVGGITWKQIATHVEGLASDARLPEGCGVEAGRGANRGSALIRVSTVNVLAEHRMLPTTYHPLTVQNPIWVGWHRDGSDASADVRQASWLYVGKKGSGKTTQLNVHISQLVRCVDALVWVIDLNGGALGVPWAEAYREGRAEQPAVDWIAGTGDEALLMTEFALGVALDRKRSARALKRKDNVTLMPVSPELPAIVIVCDEVAEIIGERTKYPQVRNNIAEIHRIARDAAVNITLAALRGTADMVDTGIKSGCDVRTVMQVADDSELAQVVGWNSGVSPEDAPYKGCGIVKPSTQETPRPFKGADMLPSHIYDCSIAVASIRPALDEASITAGSARTGKDVYAQRWQRTATLFDSTQTPTDPVPTTVISPQKESVRDASVVSLTQTQNNLNDAIAKLRHTVAETQGRDPQLDNQFNTVVAGLRSELVDWSDPSQWPKPQFATPHAENPIPEPLVTIINSFTSDNREFISSADLATAVNMDAAQLGLLLSKPPFGLTSTRQRRSEYGGQPTRGFFLADLNAVAEEFRSGKRSTTEAGDA